MGLSIYWTNFAVKELENIFNYYQEKAGLSIAEKIITEIHYETLRLREHAEIGQVEELL